MDETDETPPFARQLLGLLADDTRSKEWLETFCDDRGVSAATAESTLILGTLLARSCSVGDRAAERRAEVALARAVSRKILVPTSLHGAARLAADITSRSGLRLHIDSTAIDGAGLHLWAREALPAIVVGLIRSRSPQAWSLVEESAPLVAGIEDADWFEAPVPHSDSNGADIHSYGLTSLVRLLESLLRESQARFPGVGGARDETARLEIAEAANRVLFATLTAAPAGVLASDGPWRLLLDMIPARLDGSVDTFRSSPFFLAVGGALARASSADEERRAELCGIIERKLQGSIKSRTTALELLRVILSAQNQPFLQSEVQLSVRWALHAVSSAKLSSDTGTSETSPHQLVVLAAAVIISAVSYLRISDLIGIRDGWLLPRLQAQALTWLRHGDGHPPVCSVRSHVCIPIRERLPMNAVVALFHADMVLTAYVDPMDFRARTIQGGIELGVSSPPVEDNHAREAPEANPQEKTLIADSSERWGFLIGYAVMTVLANLLQKCLSMEYHRDVAEQNSLGHEGKGGFRVGLTSPDLYRAMLHRLSHMLALQRGIEKDTTIQSTDRSVRSSETDLFASAVASLPSVQVDTWLSAVESVFAEDDSQAAMVVNHAYADVPDVEPQLQAGILTHAARAVAASAALGQSCSGHTQSWIADPRFIIQEMVSRDILSKALKLAERLAPNVSVSSSSGFRLGSAGGDLTNRYQMLAERLSAPRVEKELVANSGAVSYSAGKRYGQWAETSSAVRATIVTACFQLCTIAANVPASPALESSVLCSLAAPAFHLDSWSAENGTIGVVGGHDADIVESRRLSILQWVIARANECTALHPAAAALRLGATLILGLSPESASAFTPMIVTAHASVALWGQVDANADDMQSLKGTSDYSSGDALMFAQEISKGMKTGTQFSAFVHLLQRESKLTMAATQTYPFERSQRTELLQVAHHLAFAHNGPDAAISVIADVIHVVSSTKDSLPASASATALSVTLCLLSAHVRHAVCESREDTINFRDVGTIDTGVNNRLSRAGQLMVHAMDAALLLIKRMCRKADAMRSLRLTYLSAAEVTNMICAVNISLTSLTSTSMWMPLGVKPNASKRGKFDDALQAVYRSSGKLGATLEISAGDGYSKTVERETEHLRSNRVSLRAAASLRGGARLYERSAEDDAGSALIANKHRGARRKFRKAHWVDFAAEEPSSDDGAGEGDDDDGDDDGMFCVRPNGDGIQGWNMKGKSPMKHSRVEKPVEQIE